MSVSGYRPQKSALPRVRALVLETIFASLIIGGILAFLILGIYTSAGPWWFWVILLLFVCVFLFETVQTARQIPIARELDKTGVTILGTIVDKWREFDPDSTGCFYHVAYKFSTEYVAEQKVNQWLYEQLQIGDMVKVRYLERNPNYSRMELELVHKRY